MPRAPFQSFPQTPNESFRVMEYKGSNTGCSWHFHDEFQMSLILNGCGQRVVGDSIHTIKQGELTLLGANLPHAWRYDPLEGQQIHIVVIHFKEDFAGTDFLLKPEMRSLRLLLARARQGLQVHGTTRKKVTQLVQGLLKSNGFERVVKLLGILNALAESNELCRICSPGIRPANAELDVERLRSVYAFVEANFDQPINRCQVASIAHLSPSAFSRFFKQHTGTTFQGFLNDHRIGFACRLLAEKSLSVTDVAMRCGFSSTTSFNRCFRRLKKISPSQYRQKLAIAFHEVAS